MAYARRKNIIGSVVSDKNRKFRVVEEKVRVLGHPLYKKYVRKTRRFHVSDPKEISKLGDVVEIQECKPISKTIRWKVVKVVSTEWKESDVA